MFVVLKTLQIKFALYLVWTSCEKRSFFEQRFCSMETHTIEGSTSSQSRMKISLCEKKKL